MRNAADERDKPARQAVVGAPYVRFYPLDPHVARARDLHLADLQLWARLEKNPRSGFHRSPSSPIHGTDMVSAVSRWTNIEPLLHVEFLHGVVPPSAQATHGRLGISRQAEMRPILRRPSNVSFQGYWDRSEARLNTGQWSCPIFVDGYGFGRAGGSLLLS